ncbi:syndecan-4 [Silurus meridionalis]|uniref:Syndecan n=1 Tax=Silurus meridionalis TaxID=175797 RepID=A0A8T0BZQ3_SILME|nr:syndecan-4 [Silurus meridionalis]KAF7711376.1 hypothetical protein HF521_000387 [Silurus meridionalis]KAI5108963.1 syndecan-4 precursor [Silurus meridionalis]
MLKVSLVLVLLAAAAFAESARETETWMPPNVGKSDDDPDSSGDFIFSKENVARFDDEDIYGDEYEENSGSGDDNLSPDEKGLATTKTEEFDNHIPHMENPIQPQPTDNEIRLVRQNEVAHPPSVHLSHAGEQNIFNKTEVLAAVIAGGAVGLLFAVLLILLLIYRMKKKDEGSYDLGKKPIYKKAPTTEIYA